MKKDQKNLPVKKFRLRGLSASVFENTMEKNGQVFYKVTLARTFKDSDGFKSTNTFGRDDLPLVVELAQAAWREILRREAEASAEETDSDSTES